MLLLAVLVFLSSLRLGFSIRDMEIVIVTLGVTSRMK